MLQKSKCSEISILHVDLKFLIYWATTAVSWPSHLIEADISTTISKLGLCLGQLGEMQHPTLHLALAQTILDPGGEGARVYSPYSSSS